MECGWWEMSSTRGSAFPNIYRNGTLAWSTQHWKKNAQEYELAQMLVELLEQENYHITDVGLNSLVVHVAVAIQRIQSGQYIQMTEEENQTWSAGESYELAQKCAKCITELAGVPYPEQEVRYLAIHLASKQTSQNFVIDSDVQDAVTEMLEEIYQIFQMDSGMIWS